MTLAFKIAIKYSLTENGRFCARVLVLLPISPQGFLATEYVNSSQTLCDRGLTKDWGDSGLPLLAEFLPPAEIRRGDLETYRAREAAIIFAPTLKILEARIDYSIAEIRQKLAATVAGYQSRLAQLPPARIEIFYPDEPANPQTVVDADETPWLTLDSRPSQIEYWRDELQLGDEIGCVNEEWSDKACTIVISALPYRTNNCYRVDVSGSAGRIQQCYVSRSNIYPPSCRNLADRWKYELKSGDVVEYRDGLNNVSDGKLEGVAYCFGDATVELVWKGIGPHRSLPVDIDRLWKSTRNSEPDTVSIVDDPSADLSPLTIWQNNLEKGSRVAFWHGNEMTIDTIVSIEPGDPKSKYLHFSFVKLTGLSCFKRTEMYPSCCRHPIESWKYELKAGDSICFDVGFGHKQERIASIKHDLENEVADVLFENGDTRKLSHGVIEKC